MFYSPDGGSGSTGLSLGGGEAAVELADLWVPSGAVAVSRRGPRGGFVYGQLDEGLDMGVEH